MSERSKREREGVVNNDHGKLVVNRGALVVELGPTSARVDVPAGTTVAQLLERMFVVCANGKRLAAGDDASELGCVQLSFNPVYSEPSLRHDDCMWTTAQMLLATGGLVLVEAAFAPTASVVYMTDVCDDSERDADGALKRGHIVGYPIGHDASATRCFYVSVVKPEAAENVRIWETTNALAVGAKIMLTLASMRERDMAFEVFARNEYPVGTVVALVQRAGVTDPVVVRVPDQFMDFIIAWSVVANQHDAPGFNPAWSRPYVVRRGATEKPPAADFTFRVAIIGKGLAAVRMDNAFRGMKAEQHMPVFTHPAVAGYGTLMHTDCYLGTSMRSLEPTVIECLMSLWRVDRDAPVNLREDEERKRYFVREQLEDVNKAIARRHAQTISSMIVYSKEQAIERNALTVLVAARAGSVAQTRKPTEAINTARCLYVPGVSADEIGAVGPLLSAIVMADY